MKSADGVSEEEARGHYLYTTTLRISEDGGLVKLRYTDLYGDCMAEECGCKCEGCAEFEAKKKMNQ